MSRTLGYVQTRFSRRNNRAHHSADPMRQSRYQAKLVEDPAYLEQLIVFIHLNPVSALRF